MSSMQVFPVGTSGDPRVLFIDSTADHILEALYSAEQGCWVRVRIANYAADLSPQLYRVKASRPR